MTAPIPPLFGGPLRSSNPPAVPSGPVHLVEFKAGRMTLSNRTVTPDRRKGLVYIFQSDDGLAHFCWKDRSTGTVEEDLIVFPDDVTFTLLPSRQCGGGRVYLLRFKSNSARKFFFWSQEPRTDGDETLCERVLEAVNNPAGALANMMSSRNGAEPSEGAASTRNTDSAVPPGATSPLGGTFTEADLQALLGAYSPQQLLSWMNSQANSRPGSGSTPFGIGAAAAASQESATSTTASTPATSQPPASTAAPSTTTTTTSSLPPTTPANTTAAPSNAGAPRRPGAADLAAALRAIGATMSQGKSGGSDGAEAASSIPLSDVLSAEAVIGSATSSSASADRLISHLPPGTGLPGEEELIASLRSPQFQQAANMLTAALETGQLGPLLIEMGVAREAVAGVHDVETFLRALQQHTASQGATSTSSNGTSNDAMETTTTTATKPSAANRNNNNKEESAAADATNGSQKKDGDDGSAPMEH